MSLESLTQHLGRPVRFLQVNTFYPTYLADFYAATPGLKDASYDEQMNALLDDGFSEGHIFVRPLRALGLETMQVVANNAYSQGAWMKENGFPVDGPVDGALATLRQVNAFRPDILYTNDVVSLHGGFIRLLQPRPAVIAGWRGFPMPEGSSLAAYDAILTSFDRLEADIKAHGAARVERIYPGFPEDHPVAAEPRRMDWDVVVSGSVSGLHKQRIRIIELLAAMSEDPLRPFTFGLFMPDASALALPARRFNRGARWGRDMLRLLRNARMAVNVNVDAAAADMQPPNMRLIEATGAGAFLMTSHHPDLPKFFEPGVEIETFRNPNELRAKILYYLDNPEQCDEIARRGQERCMRDHGLARRAGEFCGIMLRLLDEKLSRSA